MNCKKYILFFVLTILIGITAISFSGCSSRKTLGDFSCDELAEKYEKALSKVLNFYGEDFDSVDVVYAEALSDNIDGVNYSIYIDNKITYSYLSFIDSVDRYDIPDNAVVTTSIQDADKITFLYCNAALLATMNPDDSISDLYDFYVELYENASDDLDYSNSDEGIAMAAYNEKSGLSFVCRIEFTSYIPPTITLNFLCVENERYGI